MWLLIFESEIFQIFSLEQFYLMFLIGLIICVLLYGDDRTL